MRRKLITFFIPNKQKLIVWAVLLFISWPIILGSVNDIFLISLWDHMPEQTNQIISFLFIPFMTFFNFPLYLLINESQLSYTTASTIMLISIPINTYILACLFDVAKQYIQMRKNLDKRWIILLIGVWITLIGSTFWLSFYALLGLFLGGIFVAISIYILAKADKKTALLATSVSLLVFSYTSFITSDMFIDDYCEWIVEKSGYTYLHDENVESTKEEKKEGYQVISQSHRIRRQCEKDFKLLLALQKALQENYPYVNK